jgi:ATP-binding cassette subfamily B protein
MSARQGSCGGRLRRAVRPFTTVVGASFRVSVAGTVFAASDLLGVVIGALQPLILAALVPAAVARDRQALLAVSGLLALSMVAQWLMEILGTTARLNQIERVGQYFDEDILRTISSVPTIDTVGSAEFLDRYHLLREQRGVLGGALSALIISGGQVLTVVVTVVLAASADWRLLLVVLFALPVLTVGRWTGRWQEQAAREGAEGGRRVHAMVELAASAAPSSELRVFRAVGHYRELVAANVTAWQRPGAVAARKVAAVEAACACLYYLAALGALAWMFADVRDGTMAASALVLAVLLVARIQSVGQTAQWSVLGLRRVARTVEHYLWLKDALGEVLPVERRAGGGRGGCGGGYGGGSAGGLTVRGLDYSYPGAESKALCGVALRVEPGEVLALLGANGSGKSTLVRCIAGLLRADSGAVELAGAGAGEAACFQDFARFEVPLREAVGLGDVSNLSDVDRVLASLEAVDLREFAEKLPDGPETILGPSWTGGVGLSTGQWQRVAVGRAFMRRQPGVLLLDEPSASLDALAERELLGQLRRRGGEAAERGAIAVLVTHRPSTAALADRVVVLDAGRVLESGTPDELRRRDGGLYARLYREAAAGYEK